MSPASPPPADAPRAHIFLIGFPQSGSATLERALACRDYVVALHERGLLRKAAQTWLASPDALNRLAAADDAALEGLRERYWEDVGDAGIAPAGKIFLDSEPLNANKLPLIAKLFPEARIVFAVRDPRGAVFSAFRQLLAVTPETSGFAFARKRSASLFRDHGPDGRRPREAAAPGARISL